MLTYTVEAMTFGNDLTDADGWDNSGWMLVSRDTDDRTDSARNCVLAIEIMKYGERDVRPRSLLQEAERLTAEAADSLGTCDSHPGVHAFRNDPDPCIGWADDELPEHRHNSAHDPLNYPTSAFGIAVRADEGRVWSHDIVIQGDMYGVRPFCHTCVVPLAEGDPYEIVHSSTLARLAALVASHEGASHD